MTSGKSGMTSQVTGQHQNSSSQAESATTTYNVAASRNQDKGQGNAIDQTSPASGGITGQTTSDVNKGTTSSTAMTAMSPSSTNSNSSSEKVGGQTNQSSPNSTLPQTGNPQMQEMLVLGLMGGIADMSLMAMGLRKH